MKLTLTKLIILTTMFAVDGQDVERWMNTQDTAIIYEKIYLHIDREYYAPGDTLWFKSYLVWGMTNKLETGYKNVYVQLVSPEGEVISNRLLMSVNGTSYGDIALSDSLPSGQYTVRATTRYLENFGDKSSFHKRIWIARSGHFEKKDSLQKQEPELGEVLFFPEGGHLALNTANHVAFKVIGTDGKGMMASGRILDNSGQIITTFKTSFLGMGQFMFMPKVGVMYYVKINGYPKYNCELPEIRENGIALHCIDKTNDITVSLSRNYKTNRQQTFYLAASHKGINLFNKTITIESYEQGIRLSKSLFPLGISKITILNTELNIVAERLVFVSDGQLTTVKINTDKKEYATREKVELSIEPELAANDSMASTLSVAIVNEGYFSSDGNTQTIQSYLLLDSELKGPIESPAQYFVNDDSISSPQKIDLLMMVQGWRSYYWDDIIKKVPEGLEDWDDAGLTISGSMKQLLRGRLVIDGEIRLSSFSPLIVEKTKTDSLGRFYFDRVYLKDSAEVVLNGKNKNGRRSLEIIRDSPEKPDTLVLPELINRVLPEIGIPMKYAHEDYIKKLAWQEFDPEKGSIVLEEVMVSARKIDNTQQVLFYKPTMYLADDSYLITKSDYKYGDVRNYLIKKAGLPAGEWITIPPGIFVSKLQYFLDGEYKRAYDIYDDTQEVLPLPIKEIYQIDVDKNAGHNMALVYVYTKKLGLREPSDFSMRGKLIFRVHGFQQPNKFYSPQYTPENINDDIPDYRPTLCWSPDVIVKNGKAKLDFFTCDNLSNYVIIVEGISNNGKICIGAKRFAVNKHRDK